MKSREQGNEHKRYAVGYKEREEIKIKGTGGMKVVSTSRTREMAYGWCRWRS